MITRHLLGAAALTCALTACVQTPENGAVVWEGSVVHFDGYSPAGDVQLQAEVVVGYQPDPACAPDDPTKPRLKPQVCNNLGCTPVYPDCTGPGLPVYGFQTFATVRTSSSAANLFQDQNYELFSWSADARVPAGAFRMLRGRNGDWFRGARLRAVRPGGGQFYTVKPGAVECWSANNSTLDRWKNACTPSSDNQVLELRSAGF
jgi:hypothetical protein